MKMKRRKSSKQRLQQLVTLLAVLPTTILLSTLQNAPCVEATITFVGGKYYKTVEESRFGTQLSYGVEYVARLQFVGDYAKKANSLNHYRFVHHHHHKSQHHNNNNHHPQKSNNDNVNDNDPNHDLDQYLCDESSATNGLIVPSDDLPVALLASAGRCTIQTKAIIASNLSPKGTVRHLIIYGYDDNNYHGNIDHIDDDDDDYNNDKSPSIFKSRSKDNYFFKNYNDTTTSKPRSLSWFNDDGEQVTVSILYISNQDGLEMIDKLKQQPQESHDSGGLRILVDGYDGWIPSYDDQVTPLDIVSIISLLLLCCMALSCLSTTSNLTAQASAGILVVDGNHDGDENLLPGRYRHGLRLLNREEVLSLPEVAFRLERALGVDDVGCCDGFVTGDNANADVDVDGDISLTPLLDENNDNDKESSLMMNEAAAAASDLSSEPTEQSFHDISCTICLEDYEEGEMLRVLPCGHAFHSECIIPWLTDRSPTCPLCKALLEVVRDGDDEHRRQVAEAGGEGATDGEGDERDLEVSGEEMSGAIWSNDEEEMVDEDDEEPHSQTFSSWRSLYHSFMGTSRETTVQGQTEQQEVEVQLQESQTSNEAGEDIEIPTTSTSEPESDQQNTRSGAMGSLATSWRRLFPTSRSGTGTGTGSRNENLESSTSVNGSQNGLADLREPLLNNDSNNGSGNEVSEIV
jgi:hypothetical protein